jgi:hypothetical protein
MQTVEEGLMEDNEAAKMSKLQQGITSASFNAGQDFRLILETFRRTLESPISVKTQTWDIGRKVFKEF